MQSFVFFSYDKEIFTKLKHFLKVSIFNSNCKFNIIFHICIYYISFLVIIVKYKLCFY